MNYLDESGVKQLLEYLELQHAAINKKLDPLTPEHLKQNFYDFLLEDLVIYGGSATDQINTSTGGND